MSRNSAAAPRKDPNTGTWYFIVDVGIAADGRRRQARRRGFATKREAQAELDRLRNDVATASYAPPKRQTVAQYLVDDWLPAARVNLEESTWASYCRYINLHVVPRIGATQLRALDAGQLNRFVC